MMKQTKTAGETAEVVKEQTDFEVEKVIGMDIEPEDRSVGIFGSYFQIGFETDKKKIWLGFCDEQMMDLFRIIKPINDNVENDCLQETMCENEKVCCLCKRDFKGFGNNAQPIVTGICCDKCNKLVIVARLNEARRKQNDK